MQYRNILAPVMALMVCLALAPKAEAWFRGRYVANPYTGFYRGGVARYNPYTGGYYRGGAMYNPYVGRYAGGRGYYNPYTGRYGYAGAVYNPYTGRYGYRYGTGFGY